MIYTVARLLLFVACYAVLAGIWVATVGHGGLLLVPFIGAVVISSLLSLKLLAPQREAFAAVVQHRADRIADRYEEAKAREDVD